LASGHFGIGEPRTDERIASLALAFPPGQVCQSELTCSRSKRRYTFVA
jgi:hypothetical protein